MSRIFFLSASLSWGKKNMWIINFIINHFILMSNFQKFKMIWLFLSKSHKCSQRPKNENVVIIYSPSCRSKPVYVSFLCWTEKTTFWRIQRKKMFNVRKKLIHVWNDIRLSKWQHFHFWVNYPFKLCNCAWHLHITEQSADGALFFIHIGPDLSNHGFEENNGFSCWRLKLLNSLRRGKWLQ